MQDVTKDRDKYIGGSDIPIIMGLSPFKTRWQLLQEKAGITESDFSGNEYTEYGNVMEPKIREFINEEYGLKFCEDKVIDGDLRYHADGWDGKNLEVLEVKTTSHRYGHLDAYKLYLVQLLTGMHMYGTNRGILAVYERPEDFNEEFDPLRLQVFEIDSFSYGALIDDIWEAVDRFRFDLKRLKENPFMTEEEMQPFEVIAIADEVVRLENRLAEYKNLEAEAKEVKSRLKEVMEQYGIKKWTTNNGVKITLVPDGEDSVKKVFDEKAFKEKFSTVYEDFTVEKKVKGKSGHIRVTLPK